MSPQYLLTQRYSAKLKSLFYSNGLSHVHRTLRSCQSYTAVTYYKLCYTRKQPLLITMTTNERNTFLNQTTLHQRNQKLSITILANNAFSKYNLIITIWNTIFSTALRPLSHVFWTHCYNFPRYILLSLCASFLYLSSCQGVGSGKTLNPLLAHYIFLTILLPHFPPHPPSHIEQTLKEKKVKKIKYFNFCF